MPKPTLDEVLAIKDPMMNDNFELLIPQVPGGGDGKILRIQTKNSAKPGTNLAEVMVELFGHATVYAGARTFTHDLQVTYLEDYEGRVTRILEEWANQCRSAETQSGEFKETYATNATFRIFDQKGDLAMEWEIHNIWPNSIPEQSFDGGTGTAAIEMGVGFKFDHITLER